MNLSVFLAPVRDTPDHIALAEKLAFHAFREQPWRLDGLDPVLRDQEEADIRGVTAALPADRRHHELHRGPSQRRRAPADRGIVPAAASGAFGFCGAAVEVTCRVAEMERDGVTKLAIQPGGDIPGELRRIAEAPL